MSGMVRLRCFPAPAPAGGTDRNALVSTQVAPLLLLTGQADAPSTAERADRVATALSAAMEAATTNAKEMIDVLTIQYNKARQEKITKELLDIVGGAEALKQGAEA